MTDPRSLAHPGKNTPFGRTPHPDNIGSQPVSWGGQKNSGCLIGVIVGGWGFVPCEPQPGNRFRFRFGRAGEAGGRARRSCAKMIRYPFVARAKSGQMFPPGKRCHAGLSRGCPAVVPRLSCGCPALGAAKLSRGCPAVVPRLSSGCPALGAAKLSRDCPAVALLLSSDWSVVE